MANIFANSLAPSTWRTYRAAQQDFMSFCESVSRSPVPATEELLILYVACLSSRLTHSSIRTYLSAIRNLHIMSGAGDPLKDCLRLDQCLKGVKRLCSRQADKRLPITPLVLSAIKSVLLKKADQYDNIMLWAACCLGFFAFLRSGEFTVPSLAGFNPSIHLTPQDFTVDSIENPSMVLVRIKASKCDQAKLGVTVCVGRTHQPLCPVAAILAYLAVRGRDPGPCFCFKDGQPLTKQRLVREVRGILSEAGFNCSRFSGHSFRIGAATTAAARGLPDSSIQTLGRWSSDSFRRYIRLPAQELAAFSATLSGTHSRLPTSDHS